MLAGHPESDELEAGLARLASQARREPVMSCDAAAGREHAPEVLGWMDRALAPEASSAWAHEIRIDQSHRVSAASGSRDGQGARALILAALVGSIGFALVGIPSGYFLLKSENAPSMPRTPSPHAADRMASPDKGDRLQVPQAPVRVIDRAAPAKPPTSPDLFSSTAIAHWKPSRAVAPPTASASNHATAAQPHATAATPAGDAKPHAEAPLVAVPDTRPTTIAGWTLREVVDGTAVLEGPGGIWRVKRGDTVPGVGRVIAVFRWGNRPIVATSRGLISTP